MKGLRVGIVLFLGAAVLLWAGMAGSAATDTEKCKSSKNKEIGKYVACLQKAEAKAILKGAAPDYSKCDDKLSQKWGKLDSKYLPVCPKIGNEASLQAVSEAFRDEIALMLDGAPPCLGNGVEVGGHCWFLGFQGQSCESACVSEGLVYSDATRVYVGGDAPYAQSCGVVLSALRVPYGPLYVGASGDVGCGFCSDPGPCGVGFRRRYTGVTTSTATLPLFRRACACQ